MPEIVVKPGKKLFSTVFTWLGFSAVVFALDQLSKTWVEGLLDNGSDSVNILPFFDLSLAYNSGAAFSLLQQAGGWQRWLFIGISTAISIGVIIALFRISAEKRALKGGLSLILGGALGNLWDRLRYGEVVDFLDFYIGDAHWPVFNIADVAICVGAAIILVCTYKE